MPQSGACQSSLGATQPKEDSFQASQFVGLYPLSLHDRNYLASEISYLGNQTETR